MHPHTGTLQSDPTGATRETYSNAARLGDVSPATVDRYVAVYRERGIEGLKPFDWTGATSELVAHRDSLEELFRVNPPHTTAEACQRMEEATGVKRGLTQVRKFLKKSGLKVALHSGDSVAAEEND